jgi:hypothetical protein
MLLNRYKNFHLIQQLDPVQDHCRIYNLMNGYEFPWDMTRSLEVALMRTYCVPSISKLLNQTGEFTPDFSQTQKKAELQTDKMYIW